MEKLTTSYAKGTSTVPLREMTIGNYFNLVAQRFPDRPALVVSHQSIRWRYHEYLAEIDRLATGLLAIGIVPGDRVGIWSPNCVEWCLTQFATAKIGAIMVCINTAYQSTELEYALNKVQCKALITADGFKSSNYLAMLNELAPELADCGPGELDASKLPYLKSVIQLGQAAIDGAFNFADICDLGEYEHYQRLNELADELNPHDPINIQFTSGTTGHPKGATLTHYNLLNNGQTAARGMRLSECDRLCIPVPLYHCFGMVLGALACLAQGSCAVFPGSSFDALQTLRAVEREACTALHGVPTMFIEALEHPRFKDFDLSTLRTGVMAGSICPVEIMKRVQTQMHMEAVLIGYGQTETSPLNHLTLPDDPLEKRLSAVGRVCPQGVFAPTKSSNPDQVSESRSMTL